MCFFVVAFKIISKVKHHNKTLFPYKCHIRVEAASGQKVSHKMLKAAISVVLTAYGAVFALTGKVFPCFFLSCKANARV